MSIVDLADEKLGTRDVVRSSRTAMGDPITEHADARHRDGVPRNVFARRNEHFRGSRDHATVRNFRCTVYRRGITLPRAQQLETAGRFLSGKLFSTDVQ